MKDFKNSTMEYTEKTKELVFKNSLGKIFFALTFDDNKNVVRIFSLRAVQVLVNDKNINLKFSVEDSEVPSVISMDISRDQFNKDKSAYININQDNTNLNEKNKFIN